MPDKERVRPKAGGISNRFVWLVLLVLASLVAIAGGCGDDGGDVGRAAGRSQHQGPIRVAAAADLRGALTAFKPQLEETAGAKITFVFGSSGQLKEQLLAGADYDLFLSADRDFVLELERGGKVARWGTTPYAVGRIVLTWRKDLRPLSTVSGLTRQDVGKIAIANPAHAPYGRAAEAALQAAGVWNDIQPRLVLGENIRLTTDYVETGNADAGIVALALVIGTSTPYVPIAASMHPPIIQAGGVITGSRHETAAKRALDLLVSTKGREFLSQFGFEDPPVS